MRSTIRNVAAISVTVMIVVLMSPPAQARVIDCVVQPQPPQGACYEPVWVNGRQVIMVFPQAGAPLSPVPSAKQQPFYVLAPQTDTPQGATPGFPHDHVIQAAPGDAATRLSCTPTSSSAVRKASRPADASSTSRPLRGASRAHTPSRYPVMTSRPLQVSTRLQTPVSSFWWTWVWSSRAP